VSGTMTGRRAEREGLHPLLMLAPFALLIAYLWRVHGVHHDVFIAGSGSWGVGCLLKMALYQLVIRRLPHDPARIGTTSLLNGLASGLTELGAALAAFALLPPLSLTDVLGFGAAIGAIEAYVAASTRSSELLAGTRLEAPARELEAAVVRLPRSRRRLVTHAAPLAERIIAGALHVGTRGLVYVTFLGRGPFPAALALFAFVLADGAVAYRSLHEGRLTTPRALFRMYAILAVLALGCLGGWLALWPSR